MKWKCGCTDFYWEFPHQAVLDMQGYCVMCEQNYKRVDDMTKECKNCNQKDHESCITLLNGRELCRDCLLVDSEFEGSFHCDCGEWENDSVVTFFDTDKGKFRKCGVCNKQLMPGESREEEQRFCCCAFCSVEEANKNFHWGLNVCKICDNHFSQNMMEKIKRLPIEDDTCRCVHLDLDLMDRRIRAGYIVCPKCSKSFTRAMLEARKLHAAEAIDAFSNQSQVDHPAHYQSGGIEVIDVIEAFKLGFPLGNAIKYILRAGKKDNGLQDLEKAAWYLKYEINKIIESHSFKGKK